MNRKTHLTTQTMYQIFVRNHSEEGTFRAVKEDLPRLFDLGVDIIYLTPIHPIGEVARKGDLGSPYAIKDYYAINDELGTLEDFKDLLNEAHKLGLKVIIDIVLHHTSPDAILHQTNPEFYFLKNGKPGNKIGDWSDIIDLDYKNRDLWVYMKDMLTYWVKIGVDGFRADVAPLIPLAFWQYVRQELDKVDPDLIWLSESVEPHFLTFLHENNHVGHSDKEVYNAFDILYDYDVYPALKAYLEGQGSVQTYLDLVRFQEAEYPEGYLKIRTLENHDQPRINHLVKNDLVLKNITAWSFFARGIGYLYAGQEAKATHHPSLFTKDVISLTIKDQEYLTFIKRLIALKKKSNINNLSFTILETTEDDLIVAEYGQKVLGIFNLSGSKRKVKVPLKDGEYVDAISGKSVRILDGHIEVDAPLIISHQV